MIHILEYCCLPGASPIPLPLRWGDGAEVMAQKIVKVKSGMFAAWTYGTIVIVE